MCGGREGGGGGSGGKRASCDRVQLLTLAKACNCILMCAVLSVSLSLSKSITFSKEGKGWKVGGHSNSFGLVIIFIMQIVNIMGQLFPNHNPG